MGYSLQQKITALSNAIDELDNNIGSAEDEEYVAWAEKQIKILTAICNSYKKKRDTAEWEKTKKGLRR